MLSILWVGFALVVPISAPSAPHRPDYVYSLIEGVVYDLSIEGDEVILHTSNGVLRYHYKGLSILYLRVISYRVRILLYVIIALFIISLIPFLFNFPYGVFSMGVSGFFNYVLTVFMIVFITYLAVIFVSAIKPTPVLVVVDKAGVNHYYEISGKNKDKIIRLISMMQ